MIKKKEYEVAPSVSGHMLLKEGFHENYDYFSIHVNMYKDFITLVLLIDKDEMGLVANMRCSGDEYAAFWNEEYISNNKVAQEVIANYNKYMDGLVKKKILIAADERTEKCAGEQIKIRYVSDKIKRIGYVDGKKSDWIDLRAAENVKMKAGEFRLISLGVAMQLPEGYEAHIIPRSSTFKNFGILQANSMGLIDETYCGQEDVWKFPAYAVRDTEIHINDRLCQFRIERHQPKVIFEEVESLSKKSRGGFGSTGRS